ncbi:MAG: Lar family restriction alleviation protein [Agathobacter sp.]|nr:Lar family restriction alleviation protein [Agathobacter sp.]
MDSVDKIEIYDCPHCGGGGILEEENGCSFYVMCWECGCRSVNIDYKTPEERYSAAERTALLWNTGKVISSEPGE